MTTRASSGRLVEDMSLGCNRLCGGYFEVIKTLLKCVLYSVLSHSMLLADEGIGVNLMFNSAVLFFY